MTRFHMMNDNRWLLWVSGENQKIYSSFSQAFEAWVKKTREKYT